MLCHANLKKVKAVAYMLKYENELADLMNRKRDIIDKGRCGCEHLLLFPNISALSKANGIYV